MMFLTHGSDKKDPLMNVDAALTNTLKGEISGSKSQFPFNRLFFSIPYQHPQHPGSVGEHAGGSTITCGSTGRSRGGVRAGCTPLMLNDSDRGGRLGSEILLATLWGMAGELWRLSRERSSTCGERGEWVKAHKKPFPIET